MIAIGVDIGGTHLRIGCVDESYSVVDFVQVPQRMVLTGDSSTRLADYIKEYIQKYAKNMSIIGVCVGFPAAVDKNRAVVLNAPNIHGFNGIDVKAVLQKHLDIPVIIEKDTNLLLIHDIAKHDIPGDDTIIGCYIGTGLGNAMMIDGKIFVGYNGVACELGHIPAWDQEHRCSCGNIGCIEPLVAGKYLVSMCKEFFPNTEISDIFEKHGNDSRIEKYIRNLAIPIATEVNIIDPSTVILGGGVVSMKKFPCEKLVEAIRFYVRKPLPEKNLKFIISDDNHESGVIGAGINTFKQGLVHRIPNT